MLPVDNLLLPISADQPSGTLDEDKFLEADDKLKALLAPSPDGGDPRPTGWSKVYETALPAFETVKHLRLALVLTLAALQLHGLPGFRDGLRLVLGILERYWDTLYPPLGAGGKAGARMGLLAYLAAKPGAAGEYNFLHRLQCAPLFSSGGGVYSAETVRSGGGADPAAFRRELQAAYLRTPPAEIAEVQAALSDSIELTERLGALLEEKVPDGRVFAWRDLSAALTGIQETLAGLDPATPPKPAAAEPGASPATATISSRQDVLKQLDLICAYYSAHEPGSPLPLLLRRAQGLVTADFVEIIKDLLPGSVDSIRSFAGKRDEGQS